MDNYNWIRIENVTEPDYEPISLDDVKEHLRLDTDDHDTYLSQLITVARHEAELVTKRRFGDQVVNVFFQHWRPLRLYGCGLVSGVKIYFRNKDNGWEEIPAESYELVKATPSFINYHKDFSEPLHKDFYELVKVETSCGEDMPSGVKQWCLLRIGTLFENREADAERVVSPQAFASELLHLHMIMDF